MCVCVFVCGYMVVSAFSYMTDTALSVLSTVNGLSEYSAILELVLTSTKVDELMFVHVIFFQTICDTGPVHFSGRFLTACF